MKSCSFCQEVLPESEFYKDKSKSDGLQSRYKNCTKFLVRQWESDNPEKKKLQRKRYFKKGKNSEYQKRWRKANPQKELAYKLTRNKESRRASSRKSGHKYNISEHGRAKKCIYTRNRRSQLRGAEGKFTLQEWELLKAQYGFACLKCKRTEPDILLTPDHIVPVSRGGDNFISNIQPLCLSCNSSKGTKIVDYR